MPSIIIENKTIELSQESFDALKKSLITEQKRFMPKYGETYYFVYTDADDGKEAWTNSEADNIRLNTGNCFRTEEEAQKHADKLHAIARVTQYLYDNDMVVIPDWSDIEQAKWTISYAHDANKLYTDWVYNIQLQTLIPFINTIENAKKCIKDCEQDLKLIFDVK